VLATPLSSNSAHVSQKVPEFVHVSHGNVQSVHVKVEPSPYVPLGQELVHLVFTKYRASVFPHFVQLPRFVDKHAPQLFSHGMHTLLILA
jgi:hypothetical protein